MKFAHYINSLPYALESTSRVIQEAITRDFKTNGICISHEEFVILDTIYCHPGILQIDLAKKVLKSRAHTGKYLTALEQKGYVKREKAIKGSRQTILLNYLTDEGAKLHKSVVEQIKGYIDETMPQNLNDEDIDKLVSFLNAIKEDVEKRRKVKFD